MNSISQFFKTNLQAQTLFAIAAILLGCASIYTPFASGLISSLLLAITMAALGVTGLVWMFKEEKTSTKIWMGLLALSCIVCSVFMYRMPGATLLASTGLLMGYFFIEGIYSFVVGIKNRKQDGAGWAMFYGVLSVVCAVMLAMDWPLTGFYAVGIYVGAKLIYVGFALLTVTAAQDVVSDEVEELIEDELKHA